MVSKTNEQALEAAIELALTGLTTESVRATGGVSETPASAMVADNGFKLGVPADFDAQYALDTKFFWQFLQATQADTLARLQKFNPTDWQRKLLERFDRLMKKHGILYLLKKGLQVDDANFHLMYPAPVGHCSDKIKENFAANIFSCTRQLRYRSEERRVGIAWSCPLLKYRQAV